jgi:hypothetical protein
MVCLGLSSLLFGLAHLPPGLQRHSDLALVAAVLLLNGLSGLLGWVFWRWGFPCILCPSRATSSSIAGPGSCDPR